MNYKPYVTKVTQVPKRKPHTGHCYCKRLRISEDPLTVTRPYYYYPETNIVH
jgi:hypothetical protein